MNIFLKIPGGGRIRKDQVIAVIPEDIEHRAEVTFPPRIWIHWGTGQSCLKFKDYEERDKALSLLEFQIDQQPKPPRPKRKPKIVYGRWDKSPKKNEKD